MSDKIKVAVKFRHLLDSEETQGVLSKWEVENNQILRQDITGKCKELFTFGKTDTMMGNEHEPGIIPQTTQYIFEAVNKVQKREFSLRASYVEIYNKEVNDLLEEGKTSLKLCEVEGTTIICGVKEEEVHSPNEVMQLLKKGENIRHIGETNINECRSQSHTIF